MKKHILLLIFPIIVLICIAIYIPYRPIAAFSFVDGENISEVAYHTLNNGYQPLSSNDKQRFIHIIRAIEIRTMGTVSAMDVIGDGEIRDQFCLTLTDGTQYIIGTLLGSRYPYLNIDGTGYRVVGQESEEGLRELDDIFYDQLDHTVPW